MSRIPYPALDNLPERAREALELLPAPLNLVTMSAHAPALVAPLVSLGTTILARLEMSPRDREIIILLTATHTRCAYVFAQHRMMAVRLGLTEAETEALCAEPTGRSRFDEADRLLIEATHEILTSSTLTASTVTRLRGRFSDAELVEFFFVVGHYRMIAGLLNALDVEVDPRADVYAKLSEQYAEVR